MRFKVGDIVRISRKMKRYNWYGNINNPSNTDGKVVSMRDDTRLNVCWYGNRIAWYDETWLKLRKRP